MKSKEVECLGLRISTGMKIFVSHGNSHCSLEMEP
jgi:hypothetical protein